VQISCSAPLPVLSARLHSRVAAGQRHPGHLDAATVSEIEAELARFSQPLPIAGPQLLFDSTQPEPLALTQCLAAVRALL